MESSPPLLPSGFTLPDMKVHDNHWNGFWCSIEKITGNRYTANNYIKKITSSTSKSSSKSQKNVKISSNSDNGEFTSSFHSILKCQESLINWYTKPVPQDQQAKIDKKLLDAVVHANLPFKIVENPYVLKFLNELAPNYKPPSANTLSAKVLNNSFSSYLEKKFEIMESITDITIALDGWQDISRNSIYGFMALKEDQEYDELEKILQLSSLAINSSVIACVMDNPLVMIKMRTDLQKDYPNIVPIRCCLHAFNLLAKNISAFRPLLTVIKNNQKLVNFFTSFHIWLRTLHDWQKKEGLSYSLTTFCETRWYSLAKVCLGVKTYERAFNSCIRLSGTDNYPIIKAEIQNIINNCYHFANNDTLLTVLIPVVDAIGHLESRDATLADIFKELIGIYNTISTTNIPIDGFKNHTLAAINK
ncbi:18041_t:CDS:2 [Cetraspora pellucida]|uniref:18041_t:CDS:1 n=1 Tax=Cetraspora pellucida TaxID=1433469 RepID=A0ACA9NQT5_9GLOM|nr:18041_t:CDS:2 [Cetraspora pellucida]